MTFWQYLFLCRTLIQVMLSLMIVPLALGLRSIVRTLGIPSEVFNGDVVCPTRMIGLLDSQASGSTTDLSMRVELRYFHAGKTL